MKKVILVAVLLGSFILFNCKDDIIPPTDSDVSIFVYPDSASTVYLGDSIRFTANVFNTPNEEVQWYVNDIANGNETYGIINSDGFYYAPDTASESFDEVIIKAVSDEDNTKSDSAVLYILDRFLIYVNANEGNDNTGKGSKASPFKTISRALATALNGQTIRAAEGIYDEGIGEMFPLTPSYDVAIEGAGTGLTFVEPPQGDTAFKLLAEQVSIRYLTIRGNNKTGVGVKFAGNENTDSLSLSHLRIEDCYIGALKAGATDTIGFKDNEVSNCVYGLVTEQPGLILGLDGTSFSNIDSIAINIISPITSYIDYKWVTIDGAWIGLDLGEGSFIIMQDSYFSNIDSVAALVRVRSQFENLSHVGNNDFSGCENLCVYNASADTVFARGNIWPSTDSVTIDSQYLYDDDEDESLGPVIYGNIGP